MNHRPELYQYRSEALTRLGRFKDALKDLQEADRLTEINDAKRRSLAAAAINARFSAERTEEEKRALESQMIIERQQAASQQRHSRLILALTGAAGLLFVLIAYLMWSLVQRERTLRRAAETMATHARVIATLREGVLLVDDRSLIEYANPALLQLFGRSLEQLQGSSLDLLGLTRESLECATEKSAGGLPEGARELHLHDRNGKPVVMQVTSSRLVLSDRTLLVCVLQDVTELHRLERAVLSDTSSERNQMSSEVHEGIAQDLTGIALLLKGVGGKSQSDASTLEFIVGHVNYVLERARALARGLSPVQVAAGSLSLVLSRLAAEVSAAGSIEVAYRSELDGLHLGTTQSDHLYRIAQKCVRMSASQPGCRKIALELRLTHEALVLTSIGDGKNRTQPGVENERGWGSIAYLARVIGGTAHIEELESGGTRSIVSIPLKNLAAGVDAPAPAGITVA